MCQVTHFHHQTCHHKWAIISRPCAPTHGFNNCPSFQDDTIKETPPRVYRTTARTCPRCMREEFQIGYDGNLVRVVEGMGWGVRIGGVGWGVDVLCLGCVVL